MPRFIFLALMQTVLDRSIWLNEQGVVAPQTTLEQPKP